LSGNLFPKEDAGIDDGRNIDLAIGTLSGEGASQLAHPKTQPRQGNKALWSRLPESSKADPTYYDWPMLKEPVWKWEIPLYYYLGGLAGTSLALAAAAQLNRSGGLEDLIGQCRWIGIAGVTAGGMCLIRDLGRPSLFLNMLRVFRPTSPMNMGAWILSGAGATTFMALALSRARGALGSAGECSGYLAGIFGMGLASYTGVLVGNSVIPVWQESRKVLPILFAASGVTSTASMLEILREDRPSRRVTYIFGLGGRIAELAAIKVMERQAGAVSRVARPLKKGKSGLIWRAATIVTGASLAMMLLPKQTRRKRVVSGILGTAGSLMMRYAINEAGTPSAQDPRASFYQQRGRLAAKETGTTE
jgi:formate-dependent nitrite reductase membrane component NrfD